MRAHHRTTPALLLAATVWTAVSTASGQQVKEITGSATMNVIQYHSGIEIQRDFNRAAVPETVAAPPAVARARLDFADETLDTLAAGQGVAVLHIPNFSGAGTPNDAGLDVAAFSADEVTSWLVEGTVAENRSIVLTAADLGGGVSGGRTQVDSRVLLSGVMLIMAEDQAADLSRVEAELTVYIVQRPPGATPMRVMEAEVLLGGGPDGAVTVRRATGSLAGVSLPVLQFPELTPDLPMVRAIVFNGVNLQYSYEVVAGEAFDLELHVQAHVRTQPGGTGAAAVFGLPQEGLESVLARIKGDDRGARLAAAIAQHVDTTGESYASPSDPAAALWRLFFPFCGGLGLESVGLALVGGGLCLVRRRRRSARRGESAY